MTKIIKNKLNLFQKNETLIQVLLLFAVLASCSWSLLIPGLGVGHDLNHQARIFEMALALKEGVFPVIWSRDLTYGLGMPLFEFYAPFPYFFGAIWHLLGFDLTVSVKLMTFFANVLTVIGSYFLGKEIFRNKWAAVLISATISLAPYRAVDMYVRTAISEGWAITFLILVLLGMAMIINRKRFGWLLMSTSFSGLILSHNLTALMSMPFLVVFGISYCFIQGSNWKERFQSILQLLLAGFLGVALSTFYFVPALLEKGYTQLDSYALNNFYDFRQHFLYVRQFIKPWGAWEYGGSGWGPNDEMSYFLGYGQLAVLVLALTPLALFFKKDEKKWKTSWLNATLLLLVASSLVLTLLKVQKIWEMIAFTAYFQFPWRFLAIALIFTGLLAGSVYVFLSKKFKLAYFLVIYIALLAFNTRYFRSEKYQDHTDEYTDYTTIVRTVTSANLFDYLPKDITFLKHTDFYVITNPGYTELTIPAVTLFDETFTSIYHPEILTDLSTKKVFTIDPPKDMQVVMNIAYYPGWTTTINGKEIETGHDKYGFLTVPLSAGQQQVIVELRDTPVRHWSKVVSSLAVILLVVLTYLQLRKKVHVKSVNSG